MSEIDQVGGEIAGSCAVCGGSFQEPGRWVECDDCHCWSHMECVGIDVLPGTEVDFLCHRCKASNKTVGASFMDSIANRTSSSRMSLNATVMPAKVIDEGAKCNLNLSQSKISRYFKSNNEKDTFKSLGAVPKYRPSENADKTRNYDAPGNKAGTCHGNVPINRREELNWKTRGFVIPEKQGYERSHSKVDDRQTTAKESKDFKVNLSPPRRILLKKSLPSRFVEGPKYDRVQETDIRLQDLYREIELLEEDRMSLIQGEGNERKVKLEDARDLKRDPRTSQVKDNVVSDGNNARARLRRPSTLRTREDSSDRARMRRNDERDDRYNEVRGERFNERAHREPESFPTENVSDALLKLTGMLMRQNVEPLPKFNGSIEMWPIFLAQYNATSRHFDAEGNVSRLRNSLTDKALVLVKSQLAFARDPERIIAKLKEAFGRQDGVVRGIVSKLRKLPTPNDNDSKSLLNFKLELEEGLAMLQSLEATRYLESPTIVDDILDRCTRDMRKSWGKYAHEILQLRPGEAILEDLVEWAVEHTKWIVWDSDTKRADKQAKQEPSHYNQKNKKPVYVQEELEGKDEKKERIKKPKDIKDKCLSCGEEDHDILKCQKFLNMPVNKRWDVAKRKYLCFVCLKRYHREECPNKKGCSETGCGKFHHQLLHRSPAKDKEAEDKDKESKDKDNEKELNATVKVPSGSVHFKIIPVRLHSKDSTGKEISIDCNAFLDDGSAPTLIAGTLAKELKLTGPKDELCLGWTDGTSRRDTSSMRVSVMISGINHDRKFMLHRVRTVQNLNLPGPSLNVEAMKERYAHLKSLKVNQPFKERPLILIGEEHARVMSALECREGGFNEPIAVRTRLGWVVHGNVGCEGEGSLEPLLTAFMCECKTDQELNKQMADFFTQEKSNKHQKIESKEDQRALKLLEETTRLRDGRYEVGLLWKHDNVKLPDNKNMALRRLACLEARMKKDTIFGEAVRTKVADVIAKGYLRKLTPEEAQQRTNKTWYLPMFAVTNPHKPGKLRMVYDAAAKTADGVSLNEMTLKGPNESNTLVGVIWRGREGIVVVLGDIQEMFHQMRMNLEDREAQRVLFRFDSQSMIDTYILDVLSFGGCGSPGTAEHVKNKNASRFQDRYPRAVKAIKKGHYVDDMWESFNSPSEAVEICQQVKMIHAAGGFNMRGWVSNSVAVMRALNEGEEGQAVVSLNMEIDATEKVLGLCWDPKQDVFMFTLNFVRIEPALLNMARKPTKRESLKILMSIFDPHGFVAPIVVRGRILLQEMWRKGLDWDQKMPDDLFEKWCLWMQELQEVKNVRLPRCFSVNLSKAERIELHTFVDASELACCAVSYLRIIWQQECEVSFVAAKCKVAPTKYVSVPRLELEAARIGVNLADSIVAELTVRIDERTFWSDSRTALSWIQSDHRKYKQFVANRVGEILETTTVAQWRWIAGKDNVADEATKRSTNIDLSPDARWFTGPAFLGESSLAVEAETTVEETTEELRADYVCVHVENYEYIDFTRFSSWTRAVRIVAWHLRFRDVLLKRRTMLYKFKGIPMKELIAQVPPLMPTELQEAERFLFKKIQWESYQPEFTAMSNKTKISKDSRLYKLSPYLEDDTGIIRMKGRIDAAPFVEEEFKRPIILCPKHKLTELLIRHYHECYVHQNIETVVNELRQRFHISNLRSRVKQVIGHCQKCRNRKALPIVPEESPLPAARLTAHEKPFTYCGMDYFGPMQITVGRRHEKRWGVVFTCLVVRAVHMELVSSLDTDSCVLAVRNFMCRRGPVKIMYSDNGTNMRAAEKDLRESIEKLNQSRLQDEGQYPLPTQEKTEWRFITPLAPHQGGSWERMVRSIKTVLYATLKERYPKEEILRNLLVEAENIVNSRPLTYQPVDPETEEAITPNHILRLSSQVVYAPGEFEREEFSRRKWRFSQQLADEFWKRYLHEVLPIMRMRTKWFEEHRSIEVNDIVLIMDESAPRNYWKKGKVIMVHPGPDDQVRSATVKTAVGIYKRPVAKLIVLEVRDKEENHNGNSP